MKKNVKSLILCWFTIFSFATFSQGVAEIQSNHDKQLSSPPSQLVPKHMIDALGLSRKQVKQIKKNRDQYYKEQQRLDRQLMVRQGELYQELLTPTPNQQVVNRLSSMIDELNQHLQAVNITFIREFAQILTQDQIKAMSMIDRDDFLEDGSARITANAQHKGQNDSPMDAKTTHLHRQDLDIKRMNSSDERIPQSDQLKSQGPIGVKKPLKGDLKNNLSLDAKQSMSTQKPMDSKGLTPQH